jgi:hypothetical protein
VEEAEADAPAKEENETTDGGAEEEDETTDGGASGDETTYGSVGDGNRMDGGSTNPPTKKKKDRKDRTPQVLANISEEFTKVTNSGLPWRLWSLPEGRKCNSGALSSKAC